MRIAKLIAIALLAMPVHGETYKRYTNEEALVDRQISHVWNTCVQNGFRDYDGNGIVNCCDRATAFCIMWNRTYSRRVRLVQQIEKLDHMYIQVQMSWGWWSVDPKWTEDGTHDMIRVWKWRYNPNGDVIDAYWVRHFTQYIYRGY